MLAAALDVAHLAIDFNITPQAMPGSSGFVKIVSWFLWAVTLACVAGLIYAGGKFAWEKWSSGSSDAAKHVVGSLVGAIIAGSANAILNAVVA